MRPGAPPADLRGLLALLTGAACIGFAPIWVRWSEVGPVATAFYRVALALPFLALWSWSERPPATPPVPAGRDPLAPWAIAGGACFALDLAAWHLSIRYTTVANATLLANFAPIIVTLGAWLFLHERVARRFFLGMAIAFAGAWLLTGASFGADPQRLRGDLLGLLTALFYGGYQLCVARLRRVLGPGRVLWTSSLVSTPLLALMALAAGESLWPDTARGWWILAGLALTAQVLGQGLITYGFAHLPAGLSSLTLLLQPLVAVVTGWLLLGEVMSPGQVVGGIVLVLGLQVARRPLPPPR